MNGKTFPIQRGVKQGDVISPLLFNAGLEHAMRKWKLRLQHCGFDLGNGEILTNMRYADDVMLYAKLTHSLTQSRPSQQNCYGPQSIVMN